MKTVKCILLISLLALLAACGGGNIGLGPNASPLPISALTLDLQSAWNNYFKKSSTSNFSISGNLNSSYITGNGSSIVNFTSLSSALAINPASPLTGPSISLTNVSKTSLVSNSSLVINGNQSLVTTTQEYYFDALGIFKLIKDIDSNEQTVVLSFTSFPSKVTAGDSGVLYSGTIFSRLGYTCGTEVSAYSISEESNTALLVTLTTVQKTTNQQLGECSTQIATSQNVYKLTASGLSPVKFVGSTSTATGSVTLIF